MAELAAEAATEAGAEVRVRKAPETAPEGVVNGQDAWRAQAERTAHIPAATLDDLEWANAFLLTAPTRYGAAASQMRAFLDQTGPLWATGKLANKAASAMSSAQNPHGGQETTVQAFNNMFAHWGSIIVPPGYTDPVIFASGGNPYGASWVSGGEVGDVSDEVRQAAQYQGRRLAEYAERLVAAREPTAA